MTATAGAAAVESFDEAFWPLFLLAFKAAFRVLRETAAAEDVAADVLGRLHVRWGRLGHVAHRDAWVVRAATNGAIDVVRRGAPPAAVEHRPTTFEEDVASRLLVASALGNLSRRQREVLALLYLVGLSEDDTATVLGIGSGSVRRHAARGLERLRRGIEL
ncbi:MAG TPA: sigma-70 family RNA polymerase sigma factor [Acidimicrobiales bacterium]|nr:sigma-70 family RNA polymerase sigma factor [Acidimicrobiales bacterium]